MGLGEPTALLLISIRFVILLRTRAVTRRWLPTTLFSFCVLLIALMALPRHGRADAFTDALSGFAKDSYSDTADTIEKISGLGDPRALTVLQALADGNLKFRGNDGAIIIAAGDKAIDATTGQPLSGVSPQDLSDVRLNNRVRSAVQSALGRFGLFAANPTQRIAAAEAMFKNPSLDSRILLEKAIAEETDPQALAAKQRALAAMLLLGDKAEDQLQAIATLSIANDQDTRSLLLSLSQKGGLDPAVQAAVNKAIEAIDAHLFRQQIVQTIFYGLSLGSVLLLAALGLSITFGVMGVINMAHGEMVMIGAYTTYVVQQALIHWLPSAMPWSVLIAVPLSFVVAGSIGMALERGLIRHLYGRPLETLLMTWGLSMIIQQTVRLIFGASNRPVESPRWMSGSIDLLGVSLTLNRIWIILFGLLILGLVTLITRRTYYGLQMRAVTQNRAMASAMGIATSRIDALTFGLGSGIAGMAGVALSQIDNVSPNLGQSYIVDSFMVVVFGGVGNFLGTLIGAMSLGIVNKLLEPYAGAVLGKILVLVAIIIFIQFRPRGLFALRGRSVEN